MKPLDPRLLRYASAARVFLGLGAVLGLAQTVAIVAVAWFTTTAVVKVVEGSTSGLSTALLGLGVSVAARSLVAWALEVTAARAAAQVKSQLRSRVVRAVADRGRSWVDRHSSARVATLVGPGLDALDEYFARYLPQLVLTALATPLVIVVMALHDWLSALIVVLTLPLIPVFMVLIGWTTRAAQNRQWDRLTHLASSFADAVGGASTLKAFGRERRQVERIGRLTDDYRVETIKVLRVSFLSGFVLELAASLSVALVAVSIGIRLVEGSMGLTAGLFVLLLTPEAYLPLRQVGANYHAAADGVAAAEDVFELLDDEPGDVAPRATGPTGPTGSTTVADRAEPRVETDALVVDRVSVSRGGAVRLAETSFVAETGRVTAVVGPSGAGKSTLLDAVLGLEPCEGRVVWRSSGRAPARHEIAWSGQSPMLSSGTVAENVALGDAGEPDTEAVVRALDLAGAAGLDPALVLGAGGQGLSGGQAQRVSVARALYRLDRVGAHLLLVDEPSSALDRVTEARVVEGLRRIAASGVAVVVVTHRRAVSDAADVVVPIGGLS
ncbi:MULTISPECIES: thiol reductant ABC exporter subunit CydD [unclassified Frigoribacterium]|uniref:thiol reductant ABC exporter subunit CydD n=1 Tax=unclassified Frigoribacterium TaxID=2627005 RepID=UPI0006F45171|nr:MULTISPECIES: thiol reductant ABC exporter subunit CydD [unclassified Frigoribacterium]KQO46881.1 ABC transporter ATP-binding protein [Frigoribacterium sp. Leaf254]KQT38974.1 ABC transporter ATP-binding protein [Frigoribacterium sp. Leaf415]